MEEVSSANDEILQKTINDLKVKLRQSNLDKEESNQQLSTLKQTVNYYEDEVVRKQIETEELQGKLNDAEDKIITLMQQVINYYIYSFIYYP